MAEWKGRQIATPNIEKVVTGPHEAFVENIDMVDAVFKPLSNLFFPSRGE